MIDTQQERRYDPLSLTVDILVQCGAKRFAAQKYVAVFNELLPYYGITHPLRLAHFFAQLLHESNSLTAVEEYDSGAAYEGRRDLGNTQPGDGVRYKGRGLMQVTGRSNYAAFARKFGIDCINQPERLEEPRWAVATALWYWDTRRLNVYADRNDALAISQIINLGSIPAASAKRQLPNGWGSRQRFLIQCTAAFSRLV